MNLRARYGYEEWEEEEEEQVNVERLNMENVLRGMGQVTEVHMSDTVHCELREPVETSFVSSALPQLSSLPALTTLTLDIPDSLNHVTAQDLSSLTTLTSLELHRGAMPSKDEVGVDEYSEMYEWDMGKVAADRPRRLAEGFQDDVSQLQFLPALTSLTLTAVPDALTAVAARALGSLTTLTSLELHRGDVESVIKLDDFELWDIKEGFKEMYGDGYQDAYDSDDNIKPGCMDRGGEENRRVAKKYVQHRDELRRRAADEDWSQALSPLKRLTTLDLSKCLNVTDKALCALTGLTALATLKLSDGMVAAAHDHGLPASTVQQSITDKGIKAVCKLTSLTSLELAYTGVTDKGLLELRSLPALTSLALTRCDHVSAGALKALTTALPNLTVT
jgi:hypothetical protein